MKFSITPATLDGCEAVSALATKTFVENFGHLYTADNLSQHLEKTCSAAHFREGLEAGDTILLGHLDGQLIGYAKLGRVKLPLTTPAPRGAVELRRLYVDKAYQGRGFGKALMLAIFALPLVHAAPAIYLGVWENNLQAQGLYAHYGFKPVGHYLYAVGTQHDREVIMLRQRD